MAVRAVKFSRSGHQTLEGAGVRLDRAFGNGDEHEFDPFLMLDDFRNDDPSQYRRGFPWHPHRGMETITYVLEGEVDHADSMGSGIIHQEMPRGDTKGRMGGFQLWLNLPAAHKMTDPRYQGIADVQIPEVEQDGALVRVIAGAVGDVIGPVTDIFVDPEYLDVRLQPGASWEHLTLTGHTAFAYLYEGEARFGEEAGPAKADPGTVVLFGDGDSVAATAGAHGARFLLAGGRPLHEPIAWRGPVVMNTVRELEEAWRELDAGTFVKHAKPRLR
jgi:redox-sensitive bicupin YhaK (pirin superfamily)